MLRGKRCPLPGLKVKLATGQVGTIVKAPTPKGRTTCDGPGVFVQVGGRTLTLLRGELTKATKRDVKAAARLENFGPTPQLGLGAMSIQRSQRELPVPQPSRVTNFAPITHLPRTWNDAVALVERGQATWQVNPETEDPSSVLIQDRYGRILAELDTVNLRMVHEKRDPPGHQPHRQFGAVRTYAGQNEFITLTKVRVMDTDIRTSWTRSIMRLDNGDPHAVYIGFYTGKNATSLRFPRSPLFGEVLRQLVEGKETDLFDGHHRFRVQVTDQSDAQALSVWLDRAMQGGQLGKLGIEWMGKDSLFESEHPSAARPLKYKVEPVVDPMDHADGNHGSLPPFEEARKALAKHPTGDIVPVSMGPGYASPWLFQRSDLEQLLAAEDHYRGILPPETQFRGLGNLAEPAPVMSKDLKLQHWETNGRQMLWVERRMVMELHRYAVPLTRINEPTEHFFVRLRMLIPRVPGDELPRFKISLVELKRALTNGTEFIAYRNTTWSPSKFRISEARRQELLVWLDSLEGQGLAGLASSDAEHATAFDHARFEATGAASDAAEALKLGQCRIAGSLIDQGYINYGRMEANAMTPQHMGIANAVHKLLRTIDEPFEKQCVRSEPVSESHARTLHAMRPGLAGRK